MQQLLDGHVVQQQIALQIEQVTQSLSQMPLAQTRSKGSGLIDSLDQLGNWSAFKERDTDVGSWDLDQTRTHNAVNEITAIAATAGADWADPTEDAAGNMTGVPYAPTPASNMTLAYDAWNRLVKVDGGPLRLTTNEYDGLGQRILRADNGIPGTPHDYYYNDQWQLLTETKDGGGVESVEAIYHWHPFYIDALATRMRASDTHFFLHDADFNVTAAVVDSTDAVVERYSYTPYGEVTFLDPSFNNQTSSIINNSHLYTGRERDPETGLQLNRHRYYASHLGRWLTRDPIGTDGGSNNLYEYVGSRPTRFSDPMGEYGFGGTDEENRIIDKVGYPGAAKANFCANTARRHTKGLPGQRGGKADAIRHCILMCCLAQKLGKDNALAIGIIHKEEYPAWSKAGPPDGYCSIEDWQKDDRGMDEYNNSVGVNIPPISPRNCVEECKAAYDEGRLRSNGGDDGYKWTSR